MNCGKKGISLESRFTYPLSTYSFAEEPLTNALKYANASEVQIRLTHDADSNLKLTIRDNGTGFELDNESAKLGLVSMKHLLPCSARTALSRVGNRERQYPLDSLLPITP